MRAWRTRTSGEETADRATGSEAATTGAMREGALALVHPREVAVARWKAAAAAAVGAAVVAGVMTGRLHLVQ